MLIARHFLISQGRRSYLIAEGEFNARMEQYIAEIKAVPLAQGCDEVFYPGEIEARNDVRNRSEGLLFPDDTLADLARIARDTKLESKLPLFI